MRLSTQPRQRFCLQKSGLFALLHILLNTITSVYPAQNDHFSDDNFFSNNDDYDPFAEDPLTTALQDGNEIWEDKCVKNGGQQALDDWLEEQESLIWCVMQNFEVTKIQDEIENKKATGDLDIVFKKYCGAPVEKTRPCIVKFLEKSRHCLRSKDREGVNVTMKMIDSAIDFMCHNSGDRMALFMAEEGLDCLTQRKEAVISCVNKTVPELFKTVNNKLQSTYPGAMRRSVDPFLVFNQENCRKGDQLRHCVEQELLKCNDPTPSNVINAMFIAMWNSTPCKKIMDRDGERVSDTNEASLSSSSRTRPNSWSNPLTLSLHLIIPSLTLITSISKKCLNNAGVR